MSEGDALRSLRRRLALWILPARKEDLRKRFRLVEHGLNQADAGTAEVATADTQLRQLQMRLGIEEWRKPEPYNVEVDELDD